MSTHSSLNLPCVHSQQSKSRTKFNICSERKGIPPKKEENLTLEEGNYEIRQY